MNWRELINGRQSYFNRKDFPVFEIRVARVSTPAEIFYRPSPEFFQFMAATGNQMVYLASPYSSHGSVSAEKAEERARRTAALTMLLLDNGVNVFSPIVYGMGFMAKGIKRETEWWMQRDFKFVEGCDSLAVHCLDKWEESPGIQREMKWALSMNKNIFLLEDNHD